MDTAIRYYGCLTMRTRRTFLIAHGTNVDSTQLGFNGCSIAGDNPNAAWLYMPSRARWIPPFSTFAINVTGGESIEFEWRLDPFDPTPVVGINGQFATVDVFDKWIPPFVNTREPEATDDPTFTIVTFAVGVTAGVPQTLYTPTAGRRIRIAFMHVQQQASNVRVLWQDSIGLRYQFPQTIYAAGSVSTVDAARHWPNRGMIFSARNEPLRINCHVGVGVGIAGSIGLIEE